MIRPTLLWISHFVPYPPKGGCFQRSYNLLRAVARDYDVYLIATRHKYAPGADTEALMALGEFCKEVRIVPLQGARSRWGVYASALKCLFGRRSFTVAYYDSASMRNIIRETVERVGFDVAHFDSVSVAEYLSEVAGTPSVLTNHNAEAAMMARRIKRETHPFKKLYFAIEAWKLRRDEYRLCPRFDVNVVVSELDASSLRPAAPRARFEVVENGVDLDYFVPVSSQGPKDSLVFVGRMDQYSNADGILWFCTEVWPLIRAQDATVVLRVVGSNPQRALREIAAHDPRIDVTGFVDDVRPYFERAYVSVIPLRDGGGTRLKVLDALSMGMPIVASRIACEGLNVVADRDLRMVESAQEFASAVLDLLHDPEARRRFSQQARRVVELQYGWNAVGRKLLDIYADLTSHSTSRTTRASS